MATSTEPPPKHVKLRYRALAYVRRLSRPKAASRRSFVDTGGPRPPIRIFSGQQSFADSGGAHSPIRLVNRRSFADSSGVRPVVRVNSKRGFADSDGPRPVVRVGSRRNFADSTGSNSGIKVVVRRSSVESGNAGSQTGEIKVNTRSRRTSRARKSPRRGREIRSKRRHRLLVPLREHGGRRFHILCGCCVEKHAFDPGEEVSSFRWGVGFDDSNYSSPNNRRLSNGTKFRLELCGLHVTTRGKNPTTGLSIDVSSVGARAASFDSGFGFTCASPIACPPPLGLAPARTLTTTLQLRSRDGKDSGNFTLQSGSSAITHSSAGFKRKAPPASSYPSYTPTTPPSPFMNDFRPNDTFKTTRARSRVSVGCNGWFFSDDDPSIVSWYRRRSSGELKANLGSATKLSQVNEASRESEADSQMKTSPKRLKRSPRVSGMAKGVYSSSPTSSTSSKPPLVPRLSSPQNSRGSRVSILLLTHDGSVSSANGIDDWEPNSAIALIPLPSSPTTGLSRPSFPATPPPPFASSRNSYSSALQSQVYDSALPPPQYAVTRSSYSSSLASQMYESTLLWHTDSENGPDEDFGPPSKRRRSTGSSSNSSGGFGFGNVSGSTSDERESLNMDQNSSARESMSLTARFSASLRLTRSHSPRTLKKALSPAARRKRGRRRRSQSGSGGRSRRMFRLGSTTKSVSPPRSLADSAPRPSIVFIDCPP